MTAPDDAICALNTFPKDPCPRLAPRVHFNRAPATDSLLQSAVRLALDSCGMGIASPADDTAGDSVDDGVEDLTHVCAIGCNDKGCASDGHATGGRSLSAGIGAGKSATSGEECWRRYCEAAAIGKRRLAWL